MTGDRPGEPVSGYKTKTQEGRQPMTNSIRHSGRVVENVQPAGPARRRLKAVDRKGNAMDIMTCPRCHAAISPAKLTRHLAMHDAPQPALAGHPGGGVTRYACSNLCVTTGHNAPVVCKHGKPALLAWRDFEAGATVYLAAVEYPTGPEYWSPEGLTAVLRSLPDAR